MTVVFNSPRVELENESDDLKKKKRRWRSQVYNGVTHLSTEPTTVRTAVHAHVLHLLMYLLRYVRIYCTYYCTYRTRTCYTYCCLIRTTY